MGRGCIHSHIHTQRHHHIAAKFIQFDMHFENIFTIIVIVVIGSECVKCSQEIVSSEFNSSSDTHTQNERGYSSVT